jgi:hypothetical protein
MKEEEPINGKKSEDEGIEKENLAILEKIRKTQRQDHLNVSVSKYLEPEFRDYIITDRDTNLSSLSILDLVMDLVIC